MNQKQRKLNQAKEDIQILNNLKVISKPRGYDWHRYSRLIEAKLEEIKRLQVKNDNH